MAIFTGHSHQVLKDEGPNKRYNSETAEASASCIRHPAYLFDIVGYNSSGGTLYLLAFDSVALPADGVAPDFPPVQLPTKSTGSLSFVKGTRLMNGLSVCLSSTDTTKTLEGGTSGLFYVTWF